MARGYFYRGQADPFAFYRTPKLLFTDPEYGNLTIAARTLYGILLDREVLSDKNGWIDKNGRIFVYMTNKNICKTLNVSDKTATKILAELEEIDLIHCVRQGQGKPCRIYVKNFLDTEHVRLMTSSSSDSELGESPDPRSKVLRCNDTGTKLNNLLDMHLEGKTDHDTYDKKKSDLQKRIDDLKSVIADLQDVETVVLMQKM